MSAGGSPPKPWERAAAGSGPAAGLPTSAVPSAIAPVASAATPSAASPALPARSDALNAVATRTASNYSTPYARTSPYSSPYGLGGMSSYSSYGSYSSPYSRFGGGMYGGMGGMGGMGGYGYGSYGMGGGMYGGPGMYGPNGQEQSLTQSFSNSTQATFQMIESIVGAFGGFAQMLESTYMATHSSFFAMVSVAEQLGNLRQTLGSVLGIFAIIRWIRTAIAKITGRPPPSSPKELTAANFAAFSGVPGADGSPAQPKPSRKPFFFFMLALFGLPYLMGKLIRTLAASQEEQQRQLANSQAADGQQSLDPSKLEFCRLLYDYTPQAQPGQQFQEGIDLEVKKGDLVAILSKTDPMGQPSEWWRCRARDGRIGYLPSPYLETIQRRPQALLQAKGAPASDTESRVNTMTSSSATDSRANSMKMVEKEKLAIKAAAKQPVPIPTKGEEAPIESFQRGGFYS